MDALSDVLRAARLNGGVFLQAEFTAPWCIAARLTPEICSPFLGPTSHLIPYHYVIEGDFWVEPEGGEPQRLTAGDMVLFPSNAPHRLGSDLGLSAVPAGQVVIPSDGDGLRAIRHGGGGARTRVVCGYLGCDGFSGGPIASLLPELIVFRIDDFGSAEWVRSTFLYAANEIAAGHAGSETLLAKVSELLFVQAVNRYIESLPEQQSGWLAGLRDPVISRVLALMHGDVAKRWSIDDLGRQAGLSRSSLAGRFTRIIGSTPMQYLSQWRMQLAAGHLKDSAASLAQIADRVGYESEAAFSRAFKKRYGASPATWRRAQTARP